MEARKEDYPETIAFVRLLNALLAPIVRGGANGRGSGGAAGMGGVSASTRAADGGMDLMHFTAFVVQHVLAHLWQRGYRCGTRPIHAYLDLSTHSHPSACRCLHLPHQWQRGCW